jgi:two-component system OmpR family response regulator
VALVPGKTTRHILIVDDDADIRAVVREYLSAEGYEVSSAGDGEEMQRILGRSAIDLVLLDLMLGNEDGLALARSLRAENPDLGIIMLTARGETVDRIIGLEMGADDYVTKPFHLRELLARIKSVERRTSALAAPPASEGERFQFEGWQIDLMRRELTSPTGEDVRMTSGEFDLLAVFVNHPNQVLSRDRLLELGRNREAGPFDRTIDVQVGRLRRKLGDDPKQPRLIRTVRSGGYLFAVPVARAPDRRVVKS